MLAALCGKLAHVGDFLLLTPQATQVAKWGVPGRVFHFDSPVIAMEWREKQESTWLANGGERPFASP
jgi:hypothetical protein